MVEKVKSEILCLSRFLPPKFMHFKPNTLFCSVV